MTAQSLRQRVLLELARSDQTDRTASFRAVTEALAKVLDVERTSIWHLLDDESAIVCEDLFCRGPVIHEDGQVLTARDHPRYFNALLESRTIRADDARTDPRTSEFTDAYMVPLGIASMMDVPIWHRGRLYGVLCCEQLEHERHWQDDEAELAANLADIVSGGMDARERFSAERRWTMLVESVSEAVFVLDLELTIRQMNEPGRRLIGLLDIGLTNEERLRDLEFRDQLGRIVPAAQLPIPRAARGEEATEILEMRHKQYGHFGWFRFHAKPILEGDEVQSLVAVVSDVTKEVRFERLKSEFLAALAHELKTPLAIARGNAQLMLEQPDLPTPLAAAMVSIERATTRTDELIQDTIDMSALTLGRLSLTREPVELGSLVSSMVERMRRPVSDRTFRTTTVAPAVVMADAIRIEQVVRRLLDNAVRNSPPGTEIETMVSVGPKCVTVSVRDHGRGIPAEQRAEVFDAFARLDGAPAGCGGLRIGLHVAREVIRLHGGDIWFESEEGRGTMFAFRLPREETS